MEREFRHPETASGWATRRAGWVDAGGRLFSDRPGWLPCGHAARAVVDWGREGPGPREGAMAIRDYDRLFIGGDWVAPEGTDTISVISPSDKAVQSLVSTSSAIR